MNNPTVFVGDMEEEVPLNVAAAIPKQTAPTTSEEIRRNHNDMGVPSSWNWKPTKPFMRRHQYSAPTLPAYIAANHYNVTLIRQTFFSVGMLISLTG